MSRYAQPIYSYPHPGYPQPPLHPYPYQQPPGPPVPVYHVDPNAFRREYGSRLAELTINSRPIIQNLSMYAQEYSRWAEIVAQCIEAHIRRVPVWMKLPAFYLLDAISKNVFEPYAQQFATFVIQLFLETYDQVDQPTRSKMEEMLLTWRTGSPTGKELFGVVPQVAIERGVWGGDSSNGADAHTRNVFYSGTGQINKSMVISELEFTLGQKERALMANPYDSATQNHISVLQQLRKLVELGGVSQEELRQILNQLRTLAQTTSGPPPPAAPHLPPSAQSPFTPAPAPAYQDHSAYANPPLPSISPASYPPAPYQYVGHEHPKIENLEISPLGPSTASTSTALAGSSSAPPATGNINELFNTLLKAGIVSANSTPIGAGATSTERDQTPPVDLDRESSRAYRKLILAQKIKLNTADLTKTRPVITKLLYEQLSAQCKQCGIRFTDSSLGKKKMEAHLDMHFRQNRKANQNIGRGHSRSWFVGLEDWISDVSTVDSKGKGHDDGLRRPMNAKAAAAAEIAKRDADLRARFVVVPPGDEAKPISCPICKENLTAEFLEDEEDWVWRNAVKKDDKVYHATCHAEALASTSSLVARLRSEITGHSRPQTPEAPISRVTPPLRNSPAPSKGLGSKRKADDDVAVVKLEPEGSPPMKKVAIGRVVTQEA